LTIATSADERWELAWRDPVFQRPSAQHASSAKNGAERATANSGPEFEPAPLKSFEMLQPERRLTKEGSLFYGVTAIQRSQNSLF